MGDAPASRAPWIAFRPTPPAPITTALLPGVSAAVLSTAPTPGDDSAGEEARPVEAEVGGHRHQLRLVHDHGLREARDPDARVERPAGPGVEAVLGHQGVGPLAEIRRAGQAGDAPAARAEERHDHPVARPDARDARADLLDEPGRLVARHHGRRRRAPAEPVAADQMHVAVADRDGADPDADLARLGRIEDHVLDDQGFPQLVADRGLHGVRL